ncbi:MAG: methyltransferase domain-containing protein [Actinomycetota bacterium]
MRPDEIEAKIASFPYWHYEFDLAGHRTPIWGRPHRNRHEQRASYIFDPLLRLFGGSLSGKRVLDLGCNAGYWSLRAVQSGCDFVLGIDGRQMHIDQADFVFRVKGIDRGRYEFVRGDVYATDLSAKGPFEIVLCLGLLYHVSDPATLIEKIGELNTELLLIDTSLSRLPGQFLELRRESGESPIHAVREQFVTVPTRKAVIALAESVGYSVATLDPAFSSYEGAPDYLYGGRRAFFCAKDPQLLHAIADQAEHLTAPRLVWNAARWRLWMASAATRRRARGALRRLIRD